MADIIVTEVSPDDWPGHGQAPESDSECPITFAVAIRDYLASCAGARLGPRYDGAVVAWSADWQAYVTVSLICQGPADPNAPDEAWSHAGKTIDILATGYEPICLN